MTEEQTSSTHPPLPPTTEDDRFSWLRLFRSRRVGATTFHRLLAEYGTAQNALAALPEVARAAGVTGYEACATGIIDAEFKAAKAARAAFVPWRSGLSRPSGADRGRPAAALGDR